MKLTLAAAAGLLVLGACQSPADWRTYTASHASFGEFPVLQEAAAEPELTADERFVQQVAGTGLFEVQASRMALTRDVSEPVRGFARMMIADHAKASAELRDLLRRKGIAAPAVEAPALLEELARLGDAAFERAYLEAQRDAHEAAIRDLEACSAGDEDVDRRAFARRLLPMLRIHDRELVHILLAPSEPEETDPTLSPAPSAPRGIARGAQRPRIPLGP